MQCVDLRINTHAEDCDESINRRDLKTRNTCKVASSKECNVEEDHLQLQRNQRHKIGGITSSPNFRERKRS